MSVAREMRHSKRNRCPICEGAEQDRRGTGERCTGFTSDDGYAHCSRDEYAGGLPQEGGGTYAHRLHGSCKCGTTHGAEVRPIKDEIEATYDYRDEKGALLFQVVRKTGKRFLQRVPDGAGDWTWKLGNVRRVLYRLPELVSDDADRTIYIVEGEKDADNLAKRGYLATCNPGGARKWHLLGQQPREVFAGRDVVLIPDRDKDGYAHVRQVEADIRPFVRSLKVLESRKGKDVSDHFATGGTLQELVPPAADVPDVAPIDAAPANETSEEAKHPSLVQFIDHDELFAPEPPANMLVRALGIGPGPATGFFGQSYVGKSITGMHTGMAVALGRDLWGVYTVRQGNWAHFDHEQGRARTKSIVQRLAAGFGVTKDDLRGKIRVAVFPPLNLTTADAVDHYARAFDDCAIATLDALKGLTPGIDENSSAIRDYMGVLARASEKTGCVPFLIHNSGKTLADSKRPRKESGRGSSAIFDECGTVFVATAGKGEPILVSHEKDRSALGGTVDDFWLRIEDVPTDDGNPNGGLRVVHVEAEQVKPKTSAPQATEKFRKLKSDILAAIRAEQLSSGNAVCARVTGGNKTVKLQALAELLQEGTVAQPGGEGSPYRATS